MNVIELKEEIDKLGIPKEWYLINEGIKSDAYILEEIRGLWKYYYFDEKGNIHDECYFKDEAEACQYLYNKLLKIHKYFLS